MSAIIFVLFCTLPVHEFAHAWAAVKLGDETPKNQGRLTLNPLAHLSLLGSLMILVAGFGYAKPVPVNTRNLKNPKKDFALISLAGPASNLIMAAIFFLLTNITFRFLSPSLLSQVIYYFFYFAATINVNLAVFNLLPIPPLDGSRLWGLVLPDKYYYTVLQYERYIMLALLFLLFTGALTAPLSWLSNLIASAIKFIVGLPFRLLP
ncbi:MAG: site-2 protease family protein [Clostridiales bacterium]|jgi:Zn-dependent protease|nr:site-2 protease family protein [Clostridiales bacterium]HOA34180.1 site-2 protease family protein [Clostridiales bacterium]HOJ35462.1 site-2 protease family protein [Clostridiales bacterium]HOL79075.1 site-2 protease family protein [Clostridiales bacterium]HPU67517.1 site-2 protease family protein [Clostridiales bacterium]